MTTSSTRSIYTPSSLEQQQPRNQILNPKELEAHQWQGSGGKKRQPRQNISPTTHENRPSTPPRKSGTPSLPLKPIGNKHNYMEPNPNFGMVEFVKLKRNL